MNHDPLNLRNLPTPEAPDDLWPAIAAELEQAPARQARPYVSIAVAAALVVAVASIALHSVPDNPTTTTTAANPELLQARAASARLEQVLRGQRDGMLDATSVESLAWMEQELGWLDVQLADSPSDTRLWQQRANLLAEMASQYQRNNWQTEIQLASY